MLAVIGIDGRDESEVALEGDGDDDDDADILGVSKDELVGKEDDGLDNTAEGSDVLLKEGRFMLLLLGTWLDE